MPIPHFGQPRYRVIADKLRLRIESGAIPPGALLPAESLLTTEFRASRGTIRQALAVLRETGLVATEHGRGTYANPRPHQSGSDTCSEPETRQREIPADPEIAEIFGVDVGAILIENESVTRWNGAVRTVVRTYRLRRARP
ncbi:GntR family transcriptional regulator [Micromonospora sp. DH14]|uniref:GntR family transcriptional regulator n=1 Tax=Micromonospora sp. DH14 TaxID=3040120 RepID=UPI002441B3B7|nr:GntR family transcriptional regulator [Micromonospora sp. DH14]MDG9677923.1 GntR family transcriptional regulator [Micromonospora sp. DH14]